MHTADVRRRIWEHAQNQLKIARYHLRRAQRTSGKTRVASYWSGLRALMEAEYWRQRAKATRDPVVTTVRVLTAKGRPVGHLFRKQNRFCFEYTVGYAQSKEPPLPDLPNKEHTYFTDSLWPFFAERLAPMETPKVAAWLRARALKTDDILGVLAALGNWSETSEYRLQVV